MDGKREIICSAFIEKISRGDRELHDDNSLLCACRISPSYKETLVHHNGEGEKCQEGLREEKWEDECLLEEKSVCHLTGNNHSAKRSARKRSGRTNERCTVQEGLLESGE